MATSGPRFLPANASASLSGLQRRLMRRALGTIAPRAIILGAQKAGTTALFDYLSDHPDVAAPTKKELNYFGCDLRHRRGPDFYQSFFPARSGPGDRRISFEATPHYLFAAAATAPRIKAFDPDLRLIAVLRNPIERAYSAWQMYQGFQAAGQHGFRAWVESCNGPEEAASYEDRRPGYGSHFATDIEEEVEAEAARTKLERPVLGHGRYAEQLDIYLQHFDPDQILVIENSALRVDTIAQLRRVEEHLGLPTNDWDGVDLSPRFVGRYESDVPADAHRLLADYYEPCNRRLEALLGHSFNWS